VNIGDTKKNRGPRKMNYILREKKRVGFQKVDSLKGWIRNWGTEGVKLLHLAKNTGL